MAFPSTSTGLPEDYSRNASSKTVAGTSAPDNLPTYQLFQHDNKSTLIPPQELAFQQMHYEKMLEERNLYPPEKLSLPPYNTLTGNMQQRALFRASLYAYHDLPSNSLPVYFHWRYFFCCKCAPAEIVVIKTNQILRVVFCMVFISWQQIRCSWTCQSVAARQYNIMRRHTLYRTLIYVTCHLIDYI